jgi:hypothetical protein
MYTILNPSWHWNFWHMSTLKWCTYFTHRKNTSSFIFNWQFSQFLTFVLSQVSSFVPEYEISHPGMQLQLYFCFMIWVRYFIPRYKIAYPGMKLPTRAQNFCEKTTSALLKTKQLLFYGWDGSFYAKVFPKWAAPW